MLAIESLVKRYRDFTAVSNLTLEARPGELLAVLGPNGAGKTTAFKCSVGLLHPTSGRVVVGGHDVAREPERAKQLLGYIPDRPFLYEKLSGEEFIRFMGHLYGADPVRLTQRANALLEAFDLKGWERELIESYSYGMRQKIVLTAVMAREPEVFVIDEPMVGLDPRAAKTLRELLAERVAAGATVLMSTHSVSLAEQVATRIAIIARGQLMAEGTMSELTRRAGEGTDLEEVFLTLTREEQDAELEGHLATAGSGQPS